MPKQMRCHCNDPVRSLIIRAFYKSTRTTPNIPYKLCPQYVNLDITDEKIQQIAGLIESVRFNKFEKIELKDPSAVWLSRVIIPPQHFCVEINATTTLVHAKIINRNENYEGDQVRYRTTLSISAHSISWTTTTKMASKIYSFPLGHDLFLEHALQHRSASFFQRNNQK